MYMYQNLEEFEDTKGVIRIRKSKKDRQHNGQQKKDKRTQRSYKTYTQNKRSSNTNPTETNINKQVLLHGML